MADEKVTSNGNVQYWWIPEISLTDPSAPSATEINTSGLNISEAISWDTSTFPGATASNDIDDRSIMDRGNATSRGFAQFAGDLTFFRPNNVQDVTSTFGKVFQAFRTPRVPGFIVARALQGTTGIAGTVAAGQWVDVYKFIAATFIDDTEGEDSVKYNVAFLPQGDVYVNTQVKNATPVVLAPLTLAVGVGVSKTVRATLGSKRATQAVRWVSSDETKATVSQNGVVTGVAAGTANITATHAAATGATTACVVTVS